MKTIIIGGVAAGASAAARLRRLDESMEIILLERGPSISYANCGLPYHLGGVIPERSSLFVMPEKKFRSWFQVDIRTENEALGYRTTGKELLDLNFAVSSLRREKPREIQARFWKAYYEDPALAIKWLFFARDVRGGLGERRLFRVILSVLALEKPEILRPLLPLVPEYGRWDDLWRLLDTPLRQDVLALVFSQWKEDSSHLAAGNSVSTGSSARRDKPATPPGQS